MTDRYVLRFSNNIIEHLGVKLYQNKPTNVIAEYIANSWDAGAENVDVTIRNSSQPNTSVIAITDDGEGMTRDILLKRFLVIGVNRRRSGRTTVAAKGRTPMGRKGIGKLAGFGISNVIEVVTYSKEEDKSVFRWFRFELDNILKNPRQQKMLLTSRYSLGKALAKNLMKLNSKMILTKIFFRSLKII